MILRQNNNPVPNPFKITFILLIYAVSIGHAFPAPKIPFAPKTYVCYQTAAPIVVDSKLDEPAWQAAAWTDYFVDIEGGSKPAPRFKTRVKMRWDSLYFYVAADLEEPDVWANLTKRDAIIFYDNDFEVFIDPDGDTHEYYELEMNAFNTVWDLFLVKPYRDGGPALNAWDIAGLGTAVQVRGTINKPGDQDQGWTLEIAYPWKILKEAAHRSAPPNNGDIWRVNFSRVEWRADAKAGKYIKRFDPETGQPMPEDNWVWSPQGLVNMHYPEMWGMVKFSEGKPGSDSCGLTADDAASWNLRQVYYREREHAEKYGGFYTDDIEKLGLPDLPSLEINAMPGYFEASLPTADGLSRIVIDHEGRIRITGN
jgi:hypothetical protein